MKRLNVILLLVTLFVSQTVFAQKRELWNEIENFIRKDSIAMPPKNGILFVGSSSFTKWKNLESTFKEYNAINRGFGGSTLRLANDYIDHLVYPYQPRQVVIYSGENDIAQDKVSAVETLNRFATFFTNIRNKYPFVPVMFVSIKESPSRKKFGETILHTNALIKNYLSNYSNTKYVDVNSKMLHKGEPRPELFLQDMLHMKQAGYDIWIKEISPYLIK